jgi:3,4-dihydroxy 2-butanone 4-phosphate synthase / GTP cyclohydrolase II
MADPTPVVTLEAEASLTTRFGTFNIAVFTVQGAAGEIAALSRGPLHGGIGLANKIRAYALQDRGLDTVDANLALGLPIDHRDYAAAAHVLRTLGLRQVRLLTNNPLKTAALEQHGIEVVERVALAMPPNPVNHDYLRTKADRMGHLLVFEG